MAQTILVVDDDPHIRDVICFTLQKAGMEAHIAKDGAEALEQFRNVSPDLIILDVGMPEMDGLEVCRQIRKTSEVPILFLSARDEEIDRVLGLEIGGDDYVTKPFSPRELVARVNVILRRAQGGGAKDESSTDAPLVIGALVVNSERHEVVFNGQALTLTALEFAIVRAFVRRPGIVFNREQIMNTAYDGNIHVSDRTIDSHIRNLRAKFAAVGCTDIIVTVHGVGFRLGRCEVA
ncbi:response regulator transcription factor [Microvirga sp. W0021]|uniref:Response regulator transcription factor n=1 Tax=Hohaiivirga grylli TaxID=3133970 RepID=A0ABV0BHQ7_9HYPH